MYTFYTWDLLKQKTKNVKINESNPWYELLNLCLVVVFLNNKLFMNYSKRYLRNNSFVLKKLYFA